jgi:hypothetical protein
MNEAAREFANASAKAGSIALLVGFLATYLAAITGLTILRTFARRTRMFLLANTVAVLLCLSLLVVAVLTLQQFSTYLLERFSGHPILCNLPGWSMYLFPLLGVVAAALTIRRSETRAPN